MGKEFRPHLACDFDEDKLKFPYIVMPKIDGVRGLNVQEQFVGRSLKRFDNPFLATRFDGPEYLGLDGELAFGAWTSPTLCRDTTGFVNRKTPKEGKPVEGDIKWHIFDMLNEQTILMPYAERLDYAADHLLMLRLPHIKLVPSQVVSDLDELLAFEDKCLDKGFEGVILRDPAGLHKHGRATVKGGAYMRIKRFIDTEIIVTELVEAMENQNEAKTNELGRTERSSHKENKVPKGMIGSIKGTLIKDVEYRGAVLFTAGTLIECGPGTMTHDERKYFWENPKEIVGTIGKVKLFPHGTKEKMRFPTWLSGRAMADM